MPKAKLPPHIQKRYLRYYATLDIPAALRPVLGKPRFVVSLETDSLTVAKRRAPPIVAAWKGQIDRARIAQGKAGPGDDTEFLRRALREASTEARRAVVLEQIEGRAADIGARDAEMGQLPSASPAAQEFFAKATGVVLPTLEHLAEWQTTCRTTAKTKDMQCADVRRFAAKFPMLRDVSRPEVRRWITSLMNEDGLTPKTVQRILSALRGYWRYMQTIGAVPDDAEPFSKLDVARQAKGKATGELRKPFDPADVVRLVQAAVDAGDAELADLITLAMWTGARIEELCILKVQDVKAGSFRVAASKTAAGVREVPIHAKLKPVITRLCAASTDGYVLTKLVPNKYGDRSNGPGKRFGKLKTAMGFGPELVFHSIRKTVVTVLENAGVPENVVADIVGHEKKTLTYGLYSGGTSLTVKAEALAKLAYSET